MLLHFWPIVKFCCTSRLLILNVTSMFSSETYQKWGISRRRIISSSKWLFYWFLCHFVISEMFGFLSVYLIILCYIILYYIILYYIILYYIILYYIILYYISTWCSTICNALVIIAYTLHYSFVSYRISFTRSVPPPFDVSCLPLLKLISFICIEANQNGRHYNGSSVVCRWRHINPNFIFYINCNSV